MINNIEEYKKALDEYSDNPYNDKLKQDLIEYVERLIPLMESCECTICKEETNSWAGNPDKWAIRLDKETYHQGCLIKLIESNNLKG